MAIPEREACLLDLLHGGVGMARGISFLSPEVLADLYWGVTDPHPSVAAAADLDLDFVFVDGSDEDAGDTCAALRAIGCAPFVVVAGPFSRSAARAGWNEALRLTISEPNRSAEWLVSAAGECISDVDKAAKMGALAIVIAEDFANQVGFFMSPSWLESSLFPHLAEAASTAASHGLPAVLHTDGFAAGAFAAVVSAGYSSVHLGGLGWERFVQQYEAARAAGLSVVGGLEGEELRAGPLRAVRAGTQASLIAHATGLLIADDGGLTTSEEVGALVSALQAARSPQGQP